MFWPFTVWGFPKPIFKPHEYWICKACCCNSTYRLRYWNLITSLFNGWDPCCNSTYRLRYWNSRRIRRISNFPIPVAIVLTVYGIETTNKNKGHKYIPYIVAIVLTVYGIETRVRLNWHECREVRQVAIVLTVYGIETGRSPETQLRLI